MTAIGKDAHLALSLERNIRLYNRTFPIERGTKDQASN